jgi:hypothetical protein
MMSKKVISYSLYGEDEKYLIGALRNAQQAAIFYPGWVTRFYIGKSVSQDLADKLEFAGAEIVRMHGREDASAMFWRYQPFFDPEVSIVMIRDTDSRLGCREAKAVKDWLNSDRGFHIMRDHPAHYCAILGGLWGGRTDRMRQLKNVFSLADPAGFYGEDQKFLKDYVYPIAKNDALIHDSFFGFEYSAKSFPTARENLEFVGEVYDENEQPRFADREVLARFQSSFLRRIRLKATSIIKGLD